MKFGQLLFGKDEEVFLLYTVSLIQSESTKIIGRGLKPKELKYLEKKIAAATINLILKIDSSGIGK